LDISYLKMEAVCSYEILVNFYLNTQRHIGLNASCFAYSSTLRMEALQSSGTFVNMYRKRAAFTITAARRSDLNTLIYFLFIQV
jgi:hypothetical protein